VTIAINKNSTPFSYNKIFKEHLLTHSTQVSKISKSRLFSYFLTFKFNSMAKNKMVQIEDLVSLIHSLCFFLLTHSFIHWLIIFVCVYYIHAQSDEDLALKQQLNLYVERVLDSDPELQMLALQNIRYLPTTSYTFSNSVNLEWSEHNFKVPSFLYVLFCRHEIRNSTSSMTNVPKPLKFLRPHYVTLKTYYEQTMAQSNVKVFLFVSLFISNHINKLWSTNTDTDTSTLIIIWENNIIKYNHKCRASTN
jgi:hypothetical protein